jgi:hypothetical protein
MAAAANITLGFPSVHALSAPLGDRSWTITGVFMVVGFAKNFEGRHNKAHCRALLAVATACTKAL